MKKRASFFSLDLYVNFCKLAKEKATERERERRTSQLNFPFLPTLWPRQRNTPQKLNHASVVKRHKWRIYFAYSKKDRRGREREREECGSRDTSAAHEKKAQSRSKHKETVFFTLSIFFVCVFVSSTSGYNKQKITEQPESFHRGD